MPIDLPSGLRQLSEQDFREIAYTVVQKCFFVHNEMGALYDELIYQRAVAGMLAGARLELPISVVFEDFRKEYYLDLLVSDGALFEFKAVEALTDRHRGQTLNYLLLAELPRGKLINFGPDLVEHEFVNAPITKKERVSFVVDDSDYSPLEDERVPLRGLVVEIVRDWGTCLDLSLYEEVLIHFLGGQDQAMHPVEIQMGGKIIGAKKLLHLRPGASICLSALNRHEFRYQDQLRRFLTHSSLELIQWINIGRKLVTFKTLSAKA